MDGCLAAKHFLKSGKPPNWADVDAAQPRTMLIDDVERDVAAESMSHVKRDHAPARACNVFRSDKTEAKCVGRPAVVGCRAPAALALWRSGAAAAEPAVARRTRTPHDVTGFFGAVCDHGVCHSAVLMTGGETYKYAATLLLRLIRSGSVPVVVVYDIACKFGGWFERLLRDTPIDVRPGDILQLEPGVRAAAGDMKYMVGDFHRAMHVRSCQAEFSTLNPRYKGCMRAAGEATELFWSQFGLGTLRRLKYMRLQNFKLVLECLFAATNVRNDDRLASWLHGRVKKLLSDITDVRGELASLPAVSGAVEVRRPRIARRSRVRSLLLARPARRSSGFCNFRG